MTGAESQGAPAVFITGGSRGIGRAVALRLARAGSRTIILNYLENDEAAAESARAIEELGSRCVLARGNLYFPDEIDRLLEIVVKEGAGVGVFVHCAALTGFKPLLETKPNQWDMTMNVSTRAFVLCVQRIAPLMPSGGSIVAISSLGSDRVLPNYGAMGAAKAALEATVRYLAAELAPRGIRVNAVAGGFVDTESIRKFPDAARILEESSRRTPLGGLGSPDDIAGVVEFLCSPPARWICGQVIVADGGVSLQ